MLNETDRYRGTTDGLHYGVNSWTKSSIRHVERHVVTFRVRRNFAIRQRSNSSRRLPSLTSRVSLRCVAHFTHVLTRYMSFRHVVIPLRRVVRAYLFDASCVRTSLTRRAYPGLFDATCIPRPLRRDVKLFDAT